MQALGSGPTLAYARTKKLCYASANGTLETQMEHEAREIAENGRTDDFREGIPGFIKKHPQIFHGRESGLSRRQWQHRRARVYGDSVAITNIRQAYNIISGICSVLRICRGSSALLRSIRRRRLGP